MVDLRAWTGQKHAESELHLGARSSYLGLDIALGRLDTC